MVWCGGVVRGVRCGGGVVEVWCVVASSVTLHEAPARLSHVPDNPHAGKAG